MQKIIKFFGKFFISILRFLCKKGKNTILFIPHENCKTDGYDIINYRSDNVLSLLHYMLSDERYKDWVLYVVLQDPSKKLEYDNYIRNNFSRKVEWVTDTRFSICKKLVSVRICITAHPHYDFSFAKSSQKIISLGYFTPFKSDYYFIASLTKKKYLSLQRKVNKSFDYHITTSDISSRIISGDTLLKYSKFYTLGFPRNDVFYSSSLDNKKREILSELQILGCERIITYTPTYRDYERRDLPLYDSNMHRADSFLTKDDLKALNKILGDNNAIMIAKMHPWQESSLIASGGYDRIFPFSVFKDKNIGLYDVLAVSDCLITDYTSTCFDFLHRDKPIIYYMYDYDLYKKNRGFSYDPVEMVCCGDIVKTGGQLISALRSVFVGEDNYRMHRHYVNSLMNLNHDGLSCKRISDFIYSL